MRLGGQPPPGRTAREMSWLPLTAQGSEAHVSKPRSQRSTRLFTYSAGRDSQVGDPRTTTAAIASSQQPSPSGEEDFGGGRNARVSLWRAMTRFWETLQQFTLENRRKPPAIRNLQQRSKTSHACTGEVLCLNRGAGATENSRGIVQNLWRTKLLCGKH